MTEEKIKHFVRVSETDLIGQKHLFMALTKIKGVSQNFADSICKVLKIPLTKKTGTLSDSEIELISNFMKKPHSIPTWQFNRIKDFESGENIHLTSSKLKLMKEFDIKRIRKNKSYKGMRHSWGLPVRGQRTRGNFRKGKTVGVQKKKVAGAKGKKG